MHCLKECSLLQCTEHELTVSEEMYEDEQRLDNYGWRITNDECRTSTSDATTLSLYKGTDTINTAGTAVAFYNKTLLHYFNNIKQTDAFVSMREAHTKQIKGRLSRV